MNFIEEKTPKGILLKILLDKWKFLAYAKNGEPIYPDLEESSLLHKVHEILFVGNRFSFHKNYDRDYSLLKIRNGSIILPYIDNDDNKTKYIFLKNNSLMDLIPARIFSTNKIYNFIKDFDNSILLDLVIVDESVLNDDIEMIKNRLGCANIIYLDDVNNYSIVKKNWEKERDMINLNMMSNNPVFLSRIHFRGGKISQVKQLLFDFDLSELDTEYILSFIRSQITLFKGDESQIRMTTQLQSLENSFIFYLYLIKRENEKIIQFIKTAMDNDSLILFRTLVLKIKGLLLDKKELQNFINYEELISNQKKILNNEKDTDEN